MSAGKSISRKDAKFAKEQPNERHIFVFFALFAPLRERNVW